jgi:hypothetical protein
MKAEPRGVYKRCVLSLEDAIGSMDMTENVQLRADPHHRVQQFATPFVQTGNGRSIEDAEGWPMGNQNIDVMGI